MVGLPDRPVAHLLGSNGPIHALTYSASPGTYILTGSADRTIRLYNPSPSQPLHPPNSYLGTSSRSSPAQQQLAVPEGRLIQSYAAHGYEVLSLSVAADNARFASAGGDRAVFLWDVATAQTLRRFGGAHGHSSRINCVAFAGQDDSLVVSGGFDCSVRIWDTKSGGGGGGGGGKPIQVLSEARDGISAVVVRGAEIIAGSVDGRIRTYDVRTGSMVTDVVGASVTSLTLTRDGNALLVGSLDSSLRLMDRSAGTCLKKYAHKGWSNTELRVQSALGGKEHLVIAGDEMAASTAGAAAAGTGRLWAWDLMSGELVKTLDVPWGPAGVEANKKKVIGRDGKEKERRNVLSCVAWKEGGFGDQFCVGGSSGVVTVYGS